MHIVEYIGSEGLKHSRLDAKRITTPHPGDAVRIAEDTFGIIGNTNVCNLGIIDICSGPSGVFLGDGYVSISGGPFFYVLPEELEMTAETKIMEFWNWGNLSPHHDNAIYYYLDRPVFNLKRTPEAKKKIAELLESVK
jgi:hypothetical protein